jgi:hypothetical protein
MTTTLDSRRVSLRLKHPAQRRGGAPARWVGFTDAAVGSAIRTRRQAPSFLHWCSPRL